MTVDAALFGISGIVHARTSIELAAGYRTFAPNAKCSAVRALTPREREVMNHVAKGRLNKQIANDMGIVEKTVKVHRARVMERLKVRSVAVLVQVITRLGISTGEPKA